MAKAKKIKKRPMEAVQVAQEKPQRAQERRSNPDSKSRDRRVIPRLSDPELRLFMGQLYKFCLVWVGISVVYIVSLISIHFSHNSLEQNRAAFFSVIVGLVAVLMYRVARGIKSYLENESLGRLSRLTERAYHLFVVMTVVAVVLTAVHITILIK